MFVLSELHVRYGSRLAGLRVLLLHAGGLSQRLPSASVLGKLFTALPLGRPMYQVRAADARGQRWETASSRRTIKAESAARTPAGAITIAYRVFVNQENSALPNLALTLILN